MADFTKYFKTLLVHEGGYVDDIHDKGGPTKYGVILLTWMQNGYDKDKDGDIDKNDLKLITKEDAELIAKKLYWDKVKGDDITSQSIAEFLFDWAYNSGHVTPSKKVQQILNLTPDGSIGPQTVAAINKANKKDLFNKLVVSRENFYRAIVRGNPSQKKFLNGWLNRNNSFKFTN